MSKVISVVYGEPTRSALIYDDGTVAEIAFGAYFNGSAYMGRWVDVGGKLFSYTSGSLEWPLIARIDPETLVCAEHSPNAQLFSELLYTDPYDVQREINPNSIFAGSNGELFALNNAYVLQRIGGVWTVLQERSINFNEANALDSYIGFAGYFVPMAVHTNNKLYLVRAFNESAADGTPGSNFSHVIDLLDENADVIFPYGASAISRATMPPVPDHAVMQRGWLANWARYPWDVHETKPFLSFDSVTGMFGEKSVVSPDTEFVGEYPPQFFTNLSDLYTRNMGAAFSVALSPVLQSVDAYLMPVIHPPGYVFQPFWTSYSKTYEVD